MTWFITPQRWPGLQPRAMVIADLPWMSYHTGPADAVRNAARLVRAGGQAVKLEGGRKRVQVIEAICDAEIPVMGHLGLTPQSFHAMGGFKVQGKNLDAAKALIEDANALEAAGCFSIVLEGIPDVVAQLITESVGVPTIGIGAGPHCDGQVLVFHDVLGLESRVPPKFVRQYASLRTNAVTGLRAWAADVRSGAFPRTRRPTTSRGTSPPAWPPPDHPTAPGARRLSPAPRHPDATAEAVATARADAGGPCSPCRAGRSGVDPDRRGRVTPMCHA